MKNKAWQYHYEDWLEQYGTMLYDDVEIGNTTQKVATGYSDQDIARAEEYANEKINNERNNNNN